VRFLTVFLILICSFSAVAVRFDLPENGFKKSVLSFYQNHNQCANSFTNRKELLKARENLIQKSLNSWVEKERASREKVDGLLSIERSLPLDRSSYITFENGSDFTLVRIFDGSLKDGQSSEMPMERKNLGISVDRDTKVYEAGLLSSTENVAHGAEAILQAMSVHFDQLLNGGRYQTLGRFQMKGDHVLYALAKPLQARMYARYGFTKIGKVNEEYFLLKIDVKDLIEKNIGRRPSPRRVNETEYWDPENEKFSWEVRLWYKEFARREEALRDSNFNSQQAKSFYPKITSDAEKRIYRDPQPAHQVQRNRYSGVLSSLNRILPRTPVDYPANYRLIIEARRKAAELLRADFENEGLIYSVYLQHLETYDRYYDTVQAPHREYYTIIIDVGLDEIVQRMPMPGAEPSFEETRQFNIRRRQEQKPQMESLGLEVDLE